MTYAPVSVCVRMPSRCSVANRQFVFSVHERRGLLITITVSSFIRSTRSVCGIFQPSRLRENG